MTNDAKGSTPARTDDIPLSSLPVPHTNQLAVNPTSDGSTESEECKHRRYERRYWLTSSLFSFVVMIGATVAAISGYGAWTETRRQSDVQERGSRPYVIGHNSYDRIIVDGAIAPSIETTSSFLGYVLYTNYGTTPAIIEFIQGDVVIDPSFEKRSAPTFYVNGLIAQAGKDVTSPFHYTRRVTGEEHAKLLRAEVFLYLRGEVKYRDVAGVLYSTKFCYEQRVENIGAATYNIYHSVNRPGCESGVN